MLHLDVRWFSSTWTQMFLETQKILWSTVMSCPTGQEGSNLNGEQYGQFFSCKYAVASNPIRIRLKFSGHKFTIIYSHLDVIKEERKNTSDPYGITQLLYTIVPSHIIPPFFSQHAITPKKFNLITTKFSMWIPPYCSNQQKRLSSWKA